MANSHFIGEVLCEPPNNKLDKFNGTLIWQDSKYSLNNGKMLLRGCVLRNTEWCFGMVIFAGNLHVCNVCFFSTTPFYMMKTRKVKIEVTSLYCVSLFTGSC